MMTHVNNFSIYYNYIRSTVFGQLTWKPHLFRTKSRHNVADDTMTSGSKQFLFNSKILADLEVDTCKNSTQYLNHISTMRPILQFWNLGQIAYKPALELQNYLSEIYKTAVINGQVNKFTDTILLLEHPPTYTVGLRATQYDHNEEKRLKDLGAEFYRTNRGGLITFHGPGQLVAYPIINLKNYKPPGVRCYVERIEETIIQLCKQLKIEAGRSPHTGVWVKDNKICAIGIHSSRYITSHGLALNCNTDLKWYEHIVPCGIEDKGITSISKELKCNVTVDEIIPKFLQCFSSVFKCDIKPLEKDNIEIFKSFLKERKVVSAQQSN